ncbi:MAG: LacI family DNA-binding transcriptional regulator [Lentisphaeria bacterium]|nr:LacI family DNA-binding transcriptional regulator [Lentisphaeria bacterium]
MAVSLKDISEKTHINICSVSQVLNHHPRAMKLREETREKILATARELGYCRNEAAAAIRKKKNNVLAFVTSEMGCIEYTGRIQNGVLDAASEMGYTITVHRLAHNSCREIASRLLGWRVAGVIFHVASLSAIKELTACLDKEGIPWGTINLKNPGGIGFTTDDARAVEEAVKFLAEEGHKHIAYFANANTLNCDYQYMRLDGYKKGLQKYCPNVPEKVYFLNDPEYFSHSSAAVELLDTFLYDKIDGVICESDNLALFLMRGAGCRNIIIPDQLSIIGFGDGSLAEYAYPPLTTLHQDFEKMGEATVKELVRIISSRNGVPEKKYPLFPVKLVKRFSTCNKNKN